MRNKPPGTRRGSLSTRFRRMNILLFAVSFCVIAFVMSVLFNNVIAKSHSEYAEQYTYSTGEALRVHLSRELGIISRVAYSDEVIAWAKDENDESKKTRAFEKMSDFVNLLYSCDLYIGLESSHQEYMVGIEQGTYGTAQLVGVLDENNAADMWYYDCVRSDSEYQFKVGVDRLVQRKRVWVDHKVSKDGVTLGVLTTGLDMSHVMGELFSHYETGKMRGLVIDNNGVVQMDSVLSEAMELPINGKGKHVSETIINKQLNDAVESYLSGGSDADANMPFTVRLTNGEYRYVTFMPIRNTNWSVMILSGATSLFVLSYFIPILTTVLLLLIAVALVSGTVNFRIMLRPLRALNDSLITLRENAGEKIYGAKRNDELGDLSRTIQDWFDQANVDTLTGLYNRRYMENGLERAMGMLSRSIGKLSVLMVDIDFFKKFNDTYGHDKGDACLKEIATAIASGAVRAGDFTARYGGEEFIVVLPNTDEKGAKVVAEALLENVRSLYIPHTGSNIAPCVTVSIGVATGIVEYGQSWEEFIKRSDEALYISKQSGRNKYTFLAMHGA